LQLESPHQPGPLRRRGSLHHVELWVPDLDRAISSIGWLLETLGYGTYQNWELGRSWLLGSTYIVIEQSPALTGDTHDRLRPGLNHLAFHTGSTAELEQLVSNALHHGWTLLFPELHPYAGGPDHYAGYLSNSDDFEVELVATDEDNSS
jgi:catechol 2,3-dioxygenase-like lactoylglutathione lyase family enzyme